MNNKANEKPSDKKEELNSKSSKQENTGAKVPLSEPADVAHKREKVGLAKSNAKSEQTKVKSTKKGKKSSSSTTALKVILVVLLLSFIALASMTAYFFSKSDSQKEDTPVIIDTNSSVVKPHVEQLPDAQPLDPQANAQGKPVVDGQQPQADDANKVATADQAGTPLPTVATATENANDKATVAEVSKPQPVTKPLTANMPDPEKIINAEVPNDESLVKEEIDKLADEEKRLEQQEKLLDKRLKMMDELTAKKEEQIKLLEKQISQIEESQKSSK